MKKIFILTFAIFAVALGVHADDIIATKDGSLINGKVKEITPTEVKYVKSSRPDGPIYTLPKSEVLVINYEDGEKELFDETESASSPVTSTVPKTNVISETSRKDNRKVIEDLNIDCLTFEGKVKKSKEAKAAIGLYFTSDSSTYVNDYVAIIPAHSKLNLDDFKTKNTCLAKDFVVLLVIYNNSDQTIYVDKGTSFVTTNGKSEALYTPSATTTTTSSSKGGSVNLGAITGALGVGGAVGTLAGGINVGGGNTNSTSVITYAQRVVPIPPKSFLEVGAVIQDCLILKNNKKIEGLTIGETRVYDESNSPDKCGAFITLSFDEQLTDTFSMHQEYYLKKIIGLNRGWATGINLSELGNVNEDAMVIYYNSIK